MRLHLSNRLLASLAMAGALTGGMLLAPASAQDPEKKPVTLTVSGTAINPDGTPGAKLPVAIKGVEKKPMGIGGGEGGGAGGESPPPDMLSQGAKKGGAQSKGNMMKTLGKGVTDDSGKFSIKVQTLGQGDETVQLEIGETTRTNWAKQSVVTKGKDVDVGNVQLREPARN